MKNIYIETALKLLNPLLKGKGIMSGRAQELPEIVVQLEELIETTTISTDTANWITGNLNELAEIYIAQGSYQLDISLSDSPDRWDIVSNETFALACVVACHLIQSASGQDSPADSLKVINVRKLIAATQTWAAISMTQVPMVSGQNTETCDPSELITRS